MSTIAQRATGSKEIAVGLVLYGGVSLAIYENGVVRAFHDLALKRNGFRFLLDLVGASDAYIDIVAGTSAGGINGLMLAAALERGTEFAPTANLWREHGDFGKLLRDISEASSARSLLDGEGYYQERLYSAFHDLVTKPGESSLQQASEMDVFITSTDVKGLERSLRDDLGAEIVDTVHRIVFHLKHRPDRCALGVRSVAQAGTEVQAAVMASIARATSTFPIAFPPFHPTQIRNLVTPKGPGPALRACKVDEVCDALHSLRQVPGAGTLDPTTAQEGRYLIDGGVLDNKPFGPAIDAIRFRLPRGRVVRKLFYVEPDPDVRSLHQDATEPTPISIAAAALSGIPGTESIGTDFERLDKERAALRWMKSLRASIDAHLAAVDPDHAELYLIARADSLAKLVASDVEGTASAQAESARHTPRALHGGCTSRVLNSADHAGAPSIEAPRSYWWPSEEPPHVCALTRDPGAASTPMSWRELFDIGQAGERLDDRARAIWRPGARQLLEVSLRAHGVAELEPWDVDFHLRRAFDALRRLDAELARCSTDDATHAARIEAQVLGVGRVIKALEVVRANCLDLRPILQQAAKQDLSYPDRQPAAALLIELTLFLAHDSGAWTGLGPELQAWLDADEPTERVNREDVLGHRSLSAARGAVVSALAAAAVTSPRTPTRWELEFQALSADRSRLDSAIDAASATANRERREGSILRLLERALERIMSDAPRAVRDGFALFSRHDSMLLPLQYVSGAWDLDELQVVRVSPRDARLGYSGDVEAAAKVTGDQLAHFSAFLRQDWRSNDILWGRLDGTCRIVEALLPDAELRDMVAGERRTVLEQLDAALLVRQFPGTCPAEQGAVIDAVGNALAAPAPETFKGLRDALVRLLQIQACAGDVTGVFKDMEEQCVRWDQASKQPRHAETSAAVRSDSGVKGASSAGLQALAAASFAEKALHGRTGAQLLDTFVELGLGTETAIGKSGRVPPNIAAEYATQAHVLLMNMVATSFARVPLAGKVVRKQLVRVPLVTIPHVINTILVMMRLSPVLMTVVLACLLTGLAGASLVAWFSHWPLAIQVGCPLAFVGVLFITEFLRPATATWSRLRWGLLLWGCLLTLLGAAIVAAHLATPGGHGGAARSGVECRPLQHAAECPAAGTPTDSKGVIQ